MGCVCMKQRVKYEETTILAAQTCFKETEVKALYELFRKPNSSLVDDGYVSKEEFQLGLFRNRNEQSLFADRIFQLFDTNHDGSIEFGEFVLCCSRVSIIWYMANRLHRTLGVKEHNVDLIGCHGLVKSMILALLDESDLILSDDAIEAIVDKTFEDADSNRDGKIDHEEWKEFVARNPTLLKNMTVTYLK
ncbi:hypothetical protein REPUB_Repub08aG0164500 [Reevesia pubescens]